MFRKIIIVVCFAFLANGIRGEVSDDTSSRSEQSVNTQNTDMASKVSKIVEEKYGLSVNESIIPSVNEGELMLQKMCEKNAGNDTFESAHTAVKSIKTCFEGIISFSELPSRIEAARPYGNLDQVFQGYCKRTDELKGCVNKFLIDVDPCLPDDQKASKYTIQNITESILKFACENEGDYIALFISEKGPQCISSKQPGIEKCIKKYLNDTKTFESYRESMNNMTDLNSVMNSASSEEEKQFSFSFELEQCRTAYKIRTCIVEELKTCKGSTPANVVESIFNLIQRSTTCSKYSRQEIDTDYSGANSIFKSMLSIIIPAVTILLARTLSS